MNKAVWITIIVALTASSYFWTSKYFSKNEDNKHKVAAAKTLVSSYWTCPMHPQIHSDKAGECPICHMKLIQVKAQQEHSKNSEQEKAQDIENRSSVEADSNQLQLLGVQRHTVEKMDLTVHIPVSGRIISPATVAFQVYEGDLRYIKAGLSFTGESSFFPDSEIQGTISSVDSIVDPTSRTVRVVGAIKKGPHGLIVETTFRGDVSIVLRNVIAIPESSVLQTGNGALVYLFNENGSLTALPVKLGLKTESYYEVLSGIGEGQEISSGPNFLIDSEAKIRGASGHSNH
jgi:multidrug efflux pump subunit AcrA (membrane-fusion protein)